MSDMALFLGVAAMMCAAYALLGGWLERAFGVDASRMTPAVERARRRGGGLLSVLYLLACAALGLLLGMAAAQRLGRAALAGIVASGVLIAAPMSFALLFVSVRHEGKGMGAAAEALLGPAAGYAMRALMVLAAAGLILGVRRPALAFAALLLPQTFWLTEVLAPRIRSEAHMRPIAFGGAMFHTAAACAGALWLAGRPLPVQTCLAANVLALVPAAAALALCIAWMKRIGRSYGPLLVTLALLLLLGLGLMMI